VAARLEDRKGDFAVSRPRQLDQQTSKLQIAKPSTRLPVSVASSDWQGITVSISKLKTEDRKL